MTDTLSEQKTLKSWQAVWLENDYIKVMILPELGGRVHRAWDKVKQRDFVYHNEVIKPALVGLLGPWISGGIEFNWPQHHRPTTFMPVDFTLEAHEDGAQTVWVGETEPMHGLQVMTGFTCALTGRRWKSPAASITGTPRRVISCGGPTRQ